MNVLNPWGFLGLAALLPVIALYFLKLKREPRVVSSTFLWRKVLDDQQVNAPFQRLRLSLLLLLQLVFLSLLAFALARPFAEAGGLQGRTAVLLFDTSAGMGTRDAGPDGKSTRLAAAVAEAEKQIAELGPYDELALVAFDTEVRRLTPFTRDPAILDAALSSLRPRDVGTKIKEALEAARALCAGRGDASWIVLSDGCFGRVRAVEKLFADASGRFLRFGREETDNVGITAVRTRSRIVEVKDEAGRPTDAVETQLLLRLENFSTKPVNAVLTVSTETERFPPKTISLAAKPRTDLFDEEEETAAVTEPTTSCVSTELFRLPLGVKGVVTARLEAPRDNFPVDNEVRVVPADEGRLRLLYVGEGNWFLERALSLVPGAVLERKTFAEFSEAWKQKGETAVGGYDVMIFERCAPPSFTAGGALFLAVLPPLSGFAAGDKKAKLPRIIDWDSGHPLLRYVGFGNVRVLETAVWKLPPEAKVLVEADCGPLLVAWNDDRRRVVAVAFDLFNSDWPYKATLPLFIRNAVQWLARSGFRRRPSAYTTGRPLVLPPVEGGSTVTLYRPAAAVSASGRFPADPADYTAERIELSAFRPTLIRDVTAAGLYRFSGLPGSAKERLYAVNLTDRNESDNAARGEIEIGGKTLTAEKELWSGKREYWPWLLWIALALLMLEWWIFHQRAGVRRVRFSSPGLPVEKTVQ